MADRSGRTRHAGNRSQRKRPPIRARWHRGTRPDRKSATGAGTGERCHRRRDGHTHHLRQRDHTATLLAASWEPDGLTILVHPNEGVDDQHAKTVLDDLLSDVETGSISSWNRSDNADDYEQVIGFLQLGVTVTAILLLSVSAIGMINIGLAGIEQCSHELLIRRALGATRASIAIQVIGSSVLLGLIIAFAAVLISAVLVWAIPWMMPADSPLEPPAYPYTAAMIAACASIVTSLVGSLAPAIKAIRLQPALALR